MQSTSGPTEVLLIRHGETDWNASGRWQGQTDVPLNGAGLRQAALLARKLLREGPRPSALWASDLSRALRTSEILGEALGLPTQLEPGLREIDVGRWSGRTSREAALLDPELHARIHAGEDLPRGGGESFGDLCKRAGAAFDRLVARHPGQRIALVSHGGVVRATLQHAVPQRTDLGIPKLLIGNTSVTILIKRAGAWHLHTLDDRSHLANPLEPELEDDAERA